MTAWLHWDHFGGWVPPTIDGSELWRLKKIEVRILLTKYGFERRGLQEVFWGSHSIHSGRLTAGTWEFSTPGSSENHLNQTIIFRLKPLIFRGVHLQLGQPKNHPSTFPGCPGQQAGKKVVQRPGLKRERSAGKMVIGSVASYNPQRNTPRNTPKLGYIGVLTCYKL